jgi:hypothetical protein
MTLDEIRLQQLLGPFNRPQGIATLNPLAFQYTDQLYPDLQSTDVGYSIAPPGSADEGYAIGPYGTADDLISTGFYGSPDVGFPFAPANRLGGLDLPRFQGVSELGRQDEDVEQVESLVEEEPSGIEKLFSRVRDIYGTGRDLIGQGISSASSFLTGNPIVGGLMSLISRMKTPKSEIAFNRMMQQGYGPQLSSIYGRGGIMQGYNPVSMFGRTPLESMLNRKNKILARKEAGKPYGESVLNELNQAISSIGGEGGGAGSFDTSAADKAGTSLGSGQFSPSTSRGRSGY